VSAQPAVLHPARDAAARGDASAVSIRTVNPADHADWDRYASRHPGYTIYHGGAFHAAVAEAFGKPAHGLAATDADGTLVGVLPLIRQASRLFGDRLVSLPYANHGGPLADSPAIATALFEAAAGLADTLGCRGIEIRDSEVRELDWPMHTDKVLMTMALPDSNAALDQSLGAKLRSQCRRALKEGAVVTHGGAELIPDFYRVFAVNMRDLGTPVYPQRWFEVLARHLGDAMRLVVVTLQGRPAAACVLMRWNDTLEIPWAAAAREFHRYSVNMLLYREALGLAIETGCRVFDFGRSTRGSGTQRFKQQWGAEPRPIYWRVRPEPGAPGKLTALLQEGWKKLPVPVANRLGPVISADLPW
jgi:serine/alanine adding enzyme